MSMLFHFFLSISIIFTSMIVGFLVNERIKNISFYHQLSDFVFIKNDRINQSIGVGVMKFLVSKTFWNKFNPKLRIDGKPDLAELKELYKEMISAEISHLIGFVGVFFISIGSFLVGKYEFGFVLLVLNIIFNLYPSLLQQQNKKRIKSMIKSYL
ncbi:hypothetical protein SAMN04488104_105317 [Algoriphagus faecimaris]|uniref:Glycosyl-4,4'-diaponeurosporenoate acyltransferase n=1 Tax=Algoriphagus faecimaris TaxID=686796 RepID=A0A1G6X9L5_9BACT|nr:hypothetical protein [Algoriphagus faecimaris]SDD74778.1 hypothetical protein SAMN04488104_105317 [Algoriphagus faecimaris]